MFWYARLNICIASGLSCGPAGQAGLVIVMSIETSCFDSSDDGLKETSYISADEVKKSFLKILYIKLLLWQSSDCFDNCIGV